MCPVHLNEHREIGPDEKQKSLVLEFDPIQPKTCSLPVCGTIGRIRANPTCTPSPPSQLTDTRSRGHRPSANDYHDSGALLAALVGTSRTLECLHAILTDRHTSAVSADGTAAKGTVSGTVAGDAIAFCVNWKQAFESVTAWSGLLLSDGMLPTVYTLWHLASTPEKVSAGKVCSVKAF